MYLEGKCISLFDLFKNNNISGYDIYIVLNDLILNYSLSIYILYLYFFYDIITGLIDIFFYIVVVYICIFNLYIYRLRLFI